MHIYQKRILDMLRQQPTMRYTELQPDEVESSHFAYHLQQLIKQGDVAHVSRGTYSLTSQGQAAVDKLSKGSVNPKAGPKVITYTLLKGDACYYLQRKDKEPYLGLLNMVGGKVHLGEFTAQASVREVYEKTGLRISTTTLHGTAEISIMHQTHLISQVVAYIYSADITGMSVPGSLLKIPAAEVETQTDIAPDLLPLLSAIQKSTAPFAVQLPLSIL